MSQPILPGATLGVLGSGQLGRMFAIAARRMGYRVHTFSPDRETPTGQVADREVYAEYSDFDALRAFASEVDVITFEFENVAYEAAECVGEYVPVRPAGRVLHTAQHRLREKRFLSGAGFPTTPFEHITDLQTLRDAAGRLGLPAVLKTAGFGYDGKGQVVVREARELEQAWASLGTDEAVLEAFVDFEREVSMVAARGVDGGFAHFGVTENRHANHILDVSIADADVPAALVARAEELTRGVLESLDVVGVLCVEYFVTRDGDLLINELAPRPHNSGHFSFDACITSQFEQQVRAVCALPLGATDRLRPSAMANLLGDLWRPSTPDWAAALVDPQVKLHLYGKRDARPGRKMGHITAFGSDGEDAAARALAARAALTGNHQE